MSRMSVYFNLPVFVIVLYNLQTSESEQVQQNVEKGKKDKKKQNAALQAGKVYEFVYDYTPKLSHRLSQNL